MSANPGYGQFMRGVQLLRLRRYPDAEAAFREGLARDPENGMLLHRLAVAQFHQEGKEKEALATIERAIGCDPSEADLHAFRALILSNLGRGKEALVAADEAISLDPESAIAFSVKAGALLRLGRHPEAETAAREALACDPDNSDAATILSHALRIQGKSAENEAQIATMLARDPEDDANHTAAGWQALQHGERGKAQEHFLEALRLNPGSEIAREGLLEAFKARSPLYSGYLKWVFWMASHSRQRQWAIIIGFYILARVFNSLRGTAYATAGMVGMAIYWLFVLWVHVARGVGNFLVLCDRFARHALNRMEKVEAAVVGGGVVTGLVLLATVMGGKFFMPPSWEDTKEILLIAGGTLIGASFPFAHTFTNDAPVGRWIMGAAGAFVLLAGTMICAAIAIGHEGFGKFAMALLIPALITVALSTVLPNFRFFRR